LLVFDVGKDGLCDEGSLGGFVTFFAHVQAKGEKGDDGGEGNGGYAHGDDDFGEAEGRLLTPRSPSPDKSTGRRRGPERGDLIWKCEIRPAVAGRAYAWILEFEKKEG